MADLGIGQSQPTTLYCDNQAAEALIGNPVFHRRTKHLDVKFHYVRDLAKQEKIAVVHVRSEDQLADMFTKPLAREKFVANRSAININGLSVDHEWEC